MAAATYRRVVTVGYVVYGGRRPAGGPAYMLLEPGGGLFATSQRASERAREIAETDDWWVEAVLK